MNAIHIVATRDIQHHRDGLLAHLGHTGVHPPVDVIFHRPFGMLPMDVIWAGGVFLAGEGPVGIEPS
ncbi:MAG: hypothetical protein ACK56I_03835, partial [bacterium]